ncbi:hypothetical protein ACJJH9_17255 [Microbulbifer sp. DLAB2-AF]|uniref:hypothetical protein n=1 Tax=Microbulbifer sp. DLAB2-AF TaxID=3243395 RepID=UPI004039791B
MTPGFGLYLLAGKSTAIPQKSLRDGYLYAPTTWSPRAYTSCELVTRPTESVARGEDRMTINALIIALALAIVLYIAIMRGPRPQRVRVRVDSPRDRRYHRLK